MGIQYISTHGEKKREPNNYIQERGAEKKKVKEETCITMQMQWKEKRREKRGMRVKRRKKQ
jgi:hypothetical protein